MFGPSLAVQPVFLFFCSGRRGLTAAPKRFFLCMCSGPPCQRQFAKPRNLRRPGRRDDGCQGSRAPPPARLSRAPRPWRERAKGKGGQGQAKKAAWRHSAGLAAWQGWDGHLHLLSAAFQFGQALAAAQEWAERGGNKESTASDCRPLRGRRTRVLAPPRRPPSPPFPRSFPLGRASAARRWCPALGRGDYLLVRSTPCMYASVHTLHAPDGVQARQYVRVWKPAAAGVPYLCSNEPLRIQPGVPPTYLSRTHLRT